MKIYLLRHGIAENGRAGQPDSERVLTLDGRDQLRRTLTTARLADAAPSLIITSPYRRAVETATIASKVLEYQGHLEHSPALVPDSSPEALWDLMRRNRTEEEILLVGHQPLFGASTGYLLGAPNLMVDFKKGALVRIDVMAFGPSPRGELKWFLTAKLAG